MANRKSKKDFINKERNKHESITEIENTISGINNKYLKSILESFFSDNEFTKKFYECPAARSHHHNYIGGLLEHTVDVLRVCKTVYNNFKDIDRDFLYTGAILHDIGKVESYDYDLVKIEYSKKGNLLDHIIISYDMVKEKINDLEIPDNISIKLLHIILSHHGQVSNGWGSPVDPKIPEAVALHYADNLDAKVKIILQNRDI